MLRRLLILFPALALAGCTLTRPTSEGADAVYSPITGNLSTIIETDLGAAYAAAQGAVEDMHLSETARHDDEKTATVSAAAPDGGTVEISLKKQSDTSTAITVAVGPFGREALARDTLDKMLDRVR